MKILRTITFFKFFKYKDDSLGNTEADTTNGILIITTIAVSLKHLRNFGKSLTSQILLINC